MKNDKNIINYTITQQMQLEYWAPHSNYILRQNIATLSVIFGITLVIGLVLIIMEHLLEPNNISMILFSILICLCPNIIEGYNIYKEWKYGRNYQTALWLLKVSPEYEQTDNIIQLKQTIDLSN